MRTLLLGFVLGAVTAIAALVEAQVFIDQQTDAVYQEVPGGC